MGRARFDLLLDQGLPRDASKLLRESGINCTHVSELGMATAEDPEILEWARARNAVVVTLDADFHLMLAVRKASKPSVVRIRMQGMDGRAIAQLLCPLLEQYATELLAGCMLTVKHRKTTCHLLSKSD